MPADAAAPGPLIVAIDGPSGVGKSTVARRLAGRLGVPYLDTGAMYRALALDLIERGIDPGDRPAAVAAARAADLRVETGDDGVLAVLLDGRPVGDRIRTPEVGEATSRISAYSEVRERMVALQRELGGRLGGVVEGRDIGTTVFPDTPHKFFLVARSEIRHRRRHHQLRAAGREVGFDRVVDEIESRDRRDSARADSPLVRAPDAVEIDTSELTADQVVERMAALVRSTGTSRD